ncbi:MAG: helix-turn-helix transcriptional regulator [Hyphomicrobiales bacterium]|nr:helix-turn-helix transcriptional regulator [Hyphomicrobiales bacterium]
MIGKRLKLARSAAGLSLRELEAKIENLVTAQAIGKYERDESMPSSDILIALAFALGVSVDYMIGDPEIILETIEFRKKELRTNVKKRRLKPRFCT